MEDSWVCIDDDDDDASNCSAADSDKIDSETEAELYSRIHHEQNLSFINPVNLSEQPSGLLVYSEFKRFFSRNKSKNESTEHAFLNVNNNNISCAKRKSSEMDADCKIFNEKLSPAKKHKTEYVCQGENVNLNLDNFESISDSHKFPVSNIKDANTVLISNDISNSFSNNTETVKQNSSDSDCDIWIEENSAQKSDLKINLLKETDAIFLSSGSDSESEISPSVARRDSFLKNLSMPNIKIDEHPKGLWHINSEDLRRSRKQSHRYHDNFDITCSNCNKRGHTFRTCPSPRVIKCFICGGNHMGYRCPNRICSNCHTVGHDRRKCLCEPYRKFCQLCNMEGHEKRNCPDIWRRYHLTTNPFGLIKGKQVQQSSNLYCWNCGKCGHFGTVCQLPHLSRNSFSTVPCVMSYDHPTKLLKSRLFILKKYSRLSMQKLNRNVNILNMSSENRTVHLEPKNELNVPTGSNGENRLSKNEKRKFRTACRFDKIQDIVNGADFPRTSKKSPEKCSISVKSEGTVKSLSKSPEKCSNSGKYEGAVKFLSLVKTEVNRLRKRWNQKLKSLNQGDAIAALYEECLIEVDPDLPESVKRTVERNFNRWRKNRLKRIRKKQKKANAMKESIQNHGLH